MIDTLDEQDADPDLEDSEGQSFVDDRGRFFGGFLLTEDDEDDDPAEDEHDREAVQFG